MIRQTKRRASNTATDFLATYDGDIAASCLNLYNGNIASWSQSLPNPYHWGADHAQEQGNNLTWVYTYDQLNRLTQARASNLLPDDNKWSSVPNNLPPQLYLSKYTYDANGNITFAERWDQFEDQYDLLQYSYQTVNNRPTRNRLYHLVESMPAGVVDPTDPLDQGVEDIDPFGPTTFDNNAATINNGDNNYRYDALGNLIWDRREGIANIEWTVAGKVKLVDHTAGNGPDLGFGYGADGQRIWKEDLQSGLTTHYIRDAQGNVMATYLAEPLVSSLKLQERHIY